MKTRCFALAAFVVLFFGAASADTTPGIQLPADGDEYSTLVARAAAHDVTVDFRALRLAHLKSRAHQRGGDEFESESTLRKEMYEASRKIETATMVRQKAEALLSIDYTNMEAHKFLRQACVILHDDACADLHHFVEFGLLTSITKTGDGKSCAKGWEAFQVPEEYFVLAMLGMKVTGQALIHEGGHSCDAMDVTDEQGTAQRFYFTIDVMMEAEAAMFR